MFRFAHPEYLYLLLAAPALIALFAWALYDRRRRLARFGDPATVATLMPDASTGRMKLKFILFTTAVILVILAAARPQFGSKLREQKSEGIEMMLAVDISNSMLAEDFEPNRLERTKYAINKLFDGLEQDRVGVIVFAGDATVQLPITSDYRMAKAFAKRISPSMASVQGTSIGKALSLAEMSFSSGSGDSRVIILITDGPAGDPGDLLQHLLVEFRDHHVALFVLDELPADLDRGAFGRADADREDPDTLLGGPFGGLHHVALVILAVGARITGGAYIRATKQSIGLDEIVRAINDMEQSELSTVRFEEYNEQFQYLIAIAFALLLVDSGCSTAAIRCWRVSTSSASNAPTPTTTIPITDEKALSASLAPADLRPARRLRGMGNGRPSRDRRSSPTPPHPEGQSGHRTIHRRHAARRIRRFHGRSGRRPALQGTFPRLAHLDLRRGVQLPRRSAGEIPQGTRRRDRSGDADRSIEELP